jgi:tellurite resistance protein
MPKKVAVNVDDLLASVEKTSKKEANAKVKVNANSLLSQVDGELEQTFRQKVINRIGKNYQEVKVALANRNQE